MKVGMLAIWDTWGVRIPVTILHLDACEVVQVGLLHKSYLVECRISHTHVNCVIVASGSRQNIQVNTDEVNGYNALQLGVGEAKASRVNVRSVDNFLVPTFSDSVHHHHISVLHVRGMLILHAL